MSLLKFLGEHYYIDIDELESQVKIFYKDNFEMYIKKADIESQAYSMQDYKRIETSITSGNQVILEKNLMN